MKRLIAILLCLSIISPSWATVVCTHHGAAQTPTLSGGSGASTNIGNTTGDTLLVVVVIENSGSVTPTDSTDGCASPCNTWVAVPNTAQTATIASKQWYVKNPTVGTNHTIVAPNTNLAVAVAAIACSGTDTTANADQSTSANSVGNPINPGSITPTVDNEVVVTSHGGNSSTFSIDSPYTITDSLNFVAGQAYAVALAYNVQTTAGATNPAWSYGSNGSVNHAHISSYKASSGGGGAILPPMRSLLGVGK